MNAAGTCSDATIGVYVNARSKMQPDRDQDDVRRENPFCISVVGFQLNPKSNLE